MTTTEPFIAVDDLEGRSTSPEGRERIRQWYESLRGDDRAQLCVTIRRDRDDLLDALDALDR